MKRALIDFAIAAVIAAGACIAAFDAKAQTVGVHLATWHDTGGLNGVNHGAYIRTERGLTAGAYRNSERHNSAYAGYTVSHPHAWGDYSMTLGLVTGYEAGTLPLALPSVRLGYVRLTVLPRVYKGQGSAGVHLSVEW